MVTSFFIGLDKEFFYRSHRDVLVKNIDPLAKLNEFIEIYVRLARKRGYKRKNVFDLRVVVLQITVYHFYLKVYA